MIYETTPLLTEHFLMYQIIIYFPEQSPRELNCRLMFHNNVHLSAEVCEGPDGVGGGGGCGDEEEGGEQSQGGDRAVGRAHSK